MRGPLPMKMIKGKVLIQFSHQAWQATRLNPINLQGTIKRQGEHEHLWPWRGERQSVVEVEFLHLARGTSLGSGKNPNTHHCVALKPEV